MPANGRELLQIEFQFNRRCEIFHSSTIFNFIVITIDCVVFFLLTKNTEYLILLRVHFAGHLAQLLVSLQNTRNCKLNVIINTHSMDSSLENAVVLFLDRLIQHLASRAHNNSIIYWTTGKIFRVLVAHNIPWSGRCPMSMPTYPSLSPSCL